MLLPRKNRFYFIRISWGCTGNCTYCTKPGVIGKYQSKLMSCCVRDFKKGLDQGYKKFIIDGDDTGAYGLDKNSNLPSLLNEITRIPGSYEISIGNLSPKWLVEYIESFKEIFKHKNNIRSIDVSIQSGSQRILKLMSRYNEVEKMINAIITLKKITPQLKIFLQGMVGFPTETKKDFLKTLDFIKKTDCDGGNFCRFSCMRNTAAEKIEPKIPQKEIDNRMTYFKKFLRQNGYQVRVKGPQSRTVVFKKKY